VAFSYVKHYGEQPSFGVKEGTEVDIIAIPTRENAGKSDLKFDLGADRPFYSNIAI